MTPQIGQSGRLGGCDDDLRPAGCVGTGDNVAVGQAEEDGCQRRVRPR